MSQLIQIVPTLPPLIGGVGDYAHCLAIQLSQDFHLPTHFLVSNQSWMENRQKLPYTAGRLSHTKASLIEYLSGYLDTRSTVLLHYVGYGYSKQGCPTWLIDGLEHWKVKHPSAQLVTMFHEIAASGPPWSRAFWTSGLQKNLTKRLVQISDRIITSKKLYAEILQDYSQGRFSDVPTLPVFSTVGEPSNLPDLSARQRHLVIFGGQGRRNKVYQSSLGQLHQICQCLNIQQIFDIGPKLDSIPTHVGNVPITATGSLPSCEVSAILSRAFAGFFKYHPAFLGKSTIFAAYCAHRVLPVSAQMTSHVEDGLYPGQHYILPEEYLAGTVSETFLQEITDNAYKWYQPHCLASQTQIFAECMVEGIAIGKEGIYET
jgi:hypothetical protein